MALGDRWRSRDHRHLVVRAPFVIIYDLVHRWHHARGYGGHWPEYQRHWADEPEPSLDAATPSAPSAPSAAYAAAHSATVVRMAARRCHSSGTAYDPQRAAPFEHHHEPPARDLGPGARCFGSSRSAGGICGGLSRQGVPGSDDGRLQSQRGAERISADRSGRRRRHVLWPSLSRSASRSRRAKSREPVARAIAGA